MAPHLENPADFSDGMPPLKEPLQVLCEDASGKYVLPFVCEWNDGAWYNRTSVKGAKPLEVRVLGWRPSI